MPLVAFNFGVADPFFSAVVSGLDATAGEHEQRYFPDGEAFVRFLTDCSNCHVVLISSLDAPSDKLLPLIIASATLRDLGAASVGLIAPYLAYMRQDKVFRSGEGVSARYFAKLLSNYFDWMTTVDPHLHRFASLNEVYDIPTAVAHAAPAIARWIQKSCPQAFLIGPDSESEQWVAEIARLASVPFITLKKVRTGDREVAVAMPECEISMERTPLLIDDIISTGRTVVEALKCIAKLNTRPPICIGIHAILAGKAEVQIRDAGAIDIITCNTISHATNKIDISSSVIDATRGLLDIELDMS